MVGVDAAEADRVAAWLAAQFDARVSIASAEVIGGGFSRRMWRVSLLVDDVPRNVIVASAAPSPLPVPSASLNTKLKPAVPLSALATARLSESRRPAMGILTSRVQAFATGSDSPGPSLPMTSSAGAR